MTLNLNVPKIQSNLTPRITVIGVGGAGGNAVNNMIQSNLEGVDFRIANTDSQAIQQSLCEDCIQLGRSITQGLGSGSRPDIGRAAAEEALDEILTELEGTNMVFITAGMGGGTGTGGAPVIARAAREAGILTVGVVTKPFHFEGVHRMRLAESGITELSQYVDTLIVIPNQNLFRIANEKTTFSDAFKMADDVLHAGVRGVTDLMVMPGLINLDFADIRAVMTEMGKAMMGTGEGEGENRAIAAAEAAISNPLLDEVSMKGARGVLINITGGPDLTLFEVDETANRIRDEVDPEANIIFGSTFDQSMEGRMRVSVVATGIDAETAIQPRPVTLSLVTTDQARQNARGAGGSTAMSGAAIQTTAELTAEQIETVMQTEIASELIMAQAVGGNSLYAYSQAAVQTTATPVIDDTLITAPEAVAIAAPEAVAEDNFIAPLPVEPEVMPEPEIRIEPERAPDPFASAAMENASRAPRGTDSANTPNFDRKKAQGLFAKMTGGATRALHAAQSGEQRAPAHAAMTSMAASAAEPKLEPYTPAQPVASQPAAPQSTPAAQPRLSGVDANSRSGLSQAEEDLLDIPAFLRRQAN